MLPDLFRRIELLPDLFWQAGAGRKAGSVRWGWLQGRPMKVGRLLQGGSVRLFFGLAGSSGGPRLFRRGSVVCVSLVVLACEREAFMSCGIIQRFV